MRQALQCKFKRGNTLRYKVIPNKIIVVISQIVSLRWFKKYQIWSSDIHAYQPSRNGHIFGEVKENFRVSCFAFKELVLMENKQVKLINSTVKLDPKILNCKLASVWMKSRFSCASFIQSNCVLSEFINTFANILRQIFSLL